MTILDLRLRVSDLDRAKDVPFRVPELALAPLAQAIGVDRILSCSALFHVVPRRKTVDVTGEVRAAVVQTCVVSLEPFETEIVEPITARFAEGEALQTKAPPATDEEEGSVGMVDLPDPIVGGMIDLGTVAQEFLAIGVDLYPRKPGVSFKPPADGGVVTPFAALARLKDSDKDGD